MATRKSALLIMDMQAAMLARLPGAAPIVAKAADAIAHARANNIPVIYVVVTFRKGIREVSEYSCKSFAGSKAHFQTLDLEEWSKITPEVAPQEGEVTVFKRRISAFTGSDLEVLLRSYDVRHLVLTGFSTSGVVLSTLCEATDKDYQLTVLSDAVGDPDEEIHRVLTTKVFPKRGDVVTVEEWINSGRPASRK